MRDYDAAMEQRFFAVFNAYFDLEHNTSTRYSDREYTLDRMVPLAEAAGNPHERLKVIHIAGTKGKGSTCHLLAALCLAGQRTCGFFASPHLATVRERFQINGELVGYDELIHQAEIYEAELRRRHLMPTLFEIMTILSLKLFASAGVEYAILETGIGGRLDATNFVPRPRCCAITPISYDHMQLLGNTIEEIAREKAGIIKPGIPVVVAPQTFPSAAAVIARRASALRSPMLAPAGLEEVGRYREAASLAPFLRENLALALAIARHASIRPRPEAFRLPEIRARCEVVRTSPLVVLDAAHNAESMRRLVEALHCRWPERRWTVILGAVCGKDISGMVRELLSLPADLILTNPHTLRLSALEQLTAETSSQGVQATVIPQLHSIQQLPTADAYLFTGSFFTALIGEKLFGPA